MTGAEVEGRSRMFSSSTTTTTALPLRIGRGGSWAHCNRTGFAVSVASGVGSVVAAADGEVEELGAVASAAFVATGVLPDGAGEGGAGVPQAASNATRSGVQADRAMDCIVRWDALGPAAVTPPRRARCATPRWPRRC